MPDKLKKEIKEECQATHEEICDEALAHYEEISKEATHWNSVVPKAIEFYKKWGNTNLNTKDKLKKEIMEEFQKVRTDAVSGMFDNPDKCGIYPTTKFFNVLDDFLNHTIDRVRGEEIIKRTKGIYFYGETDFQQGYKEYIDCLKDAEKYLRQKAVGKNICYLCGNETGYSDEELKEAVKLMLGGIIDAWQDLQLKDNK